MRRGQAAFEFLATYGWALILVLAAIGVMQYFGVWEVAGSYPDQCWIETPFTCPTYKVSESDGIQVKIISNSHQGIRIGASVDMGSCGMFTTTTFTPPNTFLNQSILQFIDGPCASLIKNQPFSLDFDITYQIDGQQVTHTAKGSIRATVEP